MKKMLVFTLFLTLLACTGTAGAAEIYCFGPKQYRHNEGRPVVYTDTFAARSGTARMIVVNGRADGEYRIRSASIVLNGIPIFASADFNAHTDSLSAAIPIEAENSLQVELKSFSGDRQATEGLTDPPGTSFERILQWFYKTAAGIREAASAAQPRPPAATAPYLTIAVIQEAPPPTASISVSPPVISRGEAAALTWSCGEAEACTLAPAIGSVAPVGSLQVSPTETTRYTLTAAGRGGTATAEITLAVDAPALRIQITAPIDGAEANGRTIAVTGTVSPPDARVGVNGTPALVTDGMFIAEDIVLDAGPNTLTALAASGGHTAESRITVHVHGIDLGLFNLEMLALQQDDRSLKMEGEVRATIINHGAGDVTVPYRIVLFEDADLDGRFDAASDNRLAEAEVGAGLPAGASEDVPITFRGVSLFRDNHLHAVIDPFDAIEEIEENNNLASLRRSGLDVSAAFLRVDTSSCPGHALLTVRIGNPGAVQVPPGLPVAFYHGGPGSTGTPIGAACTTRPLAPGGYEDVALVWSGADPLPTVVAVADDDGAGAGIYAESDEANNRTSATGPACGALQTFPNSISGLTLDASTGATLEGVRITLRTDAGGVPGDVIQHIFSAADGGFGFLNLAPGDYALTAALDGYSETVRRVRVDPDQAATRQNLILSPRLGPDDIRIVLSWGEHPHDLEAHLTGPSPNGCRSHCNYWNRQIPGALLDVDDTDGFGPESMTLTKGLPGTYRFYVHDFSNRFSTSGAALASSDAQVVIYFGSGEAPITFGVPPHPGTVWHVFEIDGQSGRVTPVDRMGFQSEPGKIDFPMIVSQPVTTLTWGVPYRYAVAARDPDPDPLTFALLKGPSGMTIDPRTGLLQWQPDAWQAGSQAVEIRVSDGRCGEDVQSFRLNVTFKPAATFLISPCSGYTPDGPLTLRWETRRAESVEIDQGIGPVPVSGSVSIDAPPAPAAYVLTARNALGATTVQVPPWPSAQISAATAEGFKELTWKATCAAECAIAPDIGQVPCSGTRSVPVSGPAQYTLSARNASGVATAATAACLDAAIQFGTQPVCAWSPGDPVALVLDGPECVGLCQIDQGVGGVPCQGIVDVRPTMPTTYTLTASTGGDPITRKTTAPLILPPAVTSFAADHTAILPGDRVTLFWDTDCAQACTIDQGIGTVAASGSVVVTPDRLPQAYTLTAERGTQSATRTVSIRHVAPSISFSAAPGTIKPGEPATLSWSTHHATACHITPDIGPVPVSGSVNVRPEQRTTYLLTAEGPGGVVSKSATVSFVRPAVQILADPEMIAPGQSTTLTWIFSDADTCRIDPGIGNVQPGGSLTLTPDGPTVYTITASGPGGTVSDSVRVSFVAPTVAISAHPQSLAPGQSATLTWNSAFAHTCSISPGVGAVPPAGAVTVSPASRTTYTITATGLGGTAQAGVTVDCAEPLIDFAPAVQTIPRGETATLTWHVENVETIWLDPLGEMPGSGSITVSPAQSTIYTLSFPGCGGAVRPTARVEVICPPSFSFVEPEGFGGRADGAYLLKWVDADCDSNARIALYYDADGSGADGTLIVSGLAEDPDGEADQFQWATAALPEGEYFIYAVIDDGLHAPVTVYAGFRITIDHSTLPMAQTILAPSDGQGWDNFGYSTAISDRYAVVGAPSHDYSGAVFRYSGAVYVFERDGRQWTEIAKLIPRGVWNCRSFGSSVAIQGETIIVGAEGWNQSEDCNSAHVFTLQDGQWIEQAVLAPDVPGGRLNFGRSVGLADDTALVGAPGDESRTGAVFPFRIQGQVWTASPKLAPHSLQYGLEFGNCLAVDGDSLLIGSLSLRPMAYMYRRHDGNWNEAAPLVVSDATQFYPVSVHLKHDAAIVGAPGLDGGRGLACIFQRSAAGGWEQRAQLTAADSLPDTHFGSTVLIDSNHAYVGTEFSALESQYAVYIYRHQEAAWKEQLKITHPDTAGSSRFGKSMAMANGYLLVGADYDSKDDSRTGLAYIYTTCAAELEARPAVILAGDTTLLRWQTELADTCRIEPGIGSVAPNGSVQVAPLETTTYTIHASGPYGETSQEITVQVTGAAPTVSLTALPASIAAGQSTTLSWQADRASEVSIAPEIGPVAPQGAMEVAPLQTTVYTITAKGPGGTAQAAVQVSVSLHAPTASIFAEPDAIEPGQWATLSWSATHAERVTITPGIGEVPSSGSLQVSPAADTTYLLRATGPGGTASAAVQITVASQNALRITRPHAGAWIERPDVTVEGTFANPSGKEASISVNGQLALIQGERFVANHVPLQEGPNTVTATAVDADGQITRTAIVVNCQINGHFIRIDAAPASGTPVLKTILTVDAAFPFASVLLTSDHQDQAVLLSGQPASCDVEFGSPGLYVFMAEVRDSAGALHTDSVAVLVEDRSALETTLRAKWNAMKARLAVGDVAGALPYYAADSREDYEEIFTSLGDDLPQVAAEMGEIEMIAAEEESATFRIRRSEVHQGHPYDITYYIYFTRDENGLWAIERY